MDAQAAARLGDEIAHGFGGMSMIAGAVAGALIGAAVIAATVATGGVAVAIMAGSIAAGGLSMFQIVKGLNTLFNLPEPATGKLLKGSFNVYINGLNAMRAGEDIASSCSGFPMSHPMWPFPVLIAEGSATVFINGKPAARLNSKMVCGAHIKSGSPNTFIGGPTVSVAFVLDIEGWMHTGFEALGIMAMGGAAILAAMAGFAALVGFVVIGGAMMGGMALLGDLGDRLGPGYRDLLQGVAGMALLGLGPKMAKIGMSPKVRYKPGFTQDDILAIPRSSRPNPADYLEASYISKHLKVFQDEGAAFLFTPDDIANPMYATFSPSKYVMAKSDLHGVVGEFKKTGDISVLESALGYDPGTFAGKEIYMMNLDNPKVIMPTGNERGVNSLWRPGGRTYPGGMREAVMDNVGIPHGNDINILLANPDVVRLQ